MTDHTRRAFLTSALAVPAAASIVKVLQPSDARVVTSPNGKVAFRLSLRDQRLTYDITFNKRTVLEPSRLGIAVEGINLGDGVVLVKEESFAINERYPVRGAHSLAINQCQGAVITLKHTASQTLHRVEVRVFDDGAAFRYVVPGSPKDQRTADELTSFMLPQGAFVWYHDFEGHYEGVHQKKEISQVSAGEWMAMPLTIRLPENSGYAAITEAVLIDYAGMGLQADGNRGLDGRLGHALPVSYPFRLRYGAAEAERLSHVARISGVITSPWRVVMVGSDLNTLVNCDIVSNLSPPPDPQLFPNGLMTDWIKPGRSVWKYLDGGENTLEEMKEFSRLAGELGFEYNLVEGFWQRWTDEQLREFIDYSRSQRVGVWLWKHSRDIHDS
jgi:alpha-glucosidase